MKEDQVAHALEKRPTEDDLEHRGIQKCKRGSMSDVLAATAVELEKQMTADKVAHSLESRPSEQHLEETGIIKGRRNSNLSSALVGTVVQLEVSFTDLSDVHDRLTYALHFLAEHDRRQGRSRSRAPSLREGPRGQGSHQGQIRKHERRPRLNRGAA